MIFKSYIKRVITISAENIDALNMKKVFQIFCPTERGPGQTACSQTWQGETKNEKANGTSNNVMSSYGNRSSMLLTFHNYHSSHRLITPHLVALLFAYLLGYAVLFVRCYFLQLQLLIQCRTLSLFQKWCFQPMLEKSIKKQRQNYIFLFRSVQKRKC